MIDFVQGVVDTEIPTSISNFELYEAKIFPNPVQDVFTINLQNLKENTTVLNLSDTSGRIVFTKEFNNNEQIDISKLRDGVYFYRISSNDKTSIGKLIKQN